MSLLTTLGTGQGFLKAGFLGFQKSGKTYTAVELALGVREFFKLPGPIAMFDTEGGSEYVAPRIERATGTALIGCRSRSFDDMVRFGEECVHAGVAVAIVDSVTHTWRELCDAYLKQVNERRARHAKERGWTFKPQRSLEFQDWGTVKGLWNDRWTQFYLNAPLHIVIAGRAGYEYDFEETNDGKRELVKTGVKMRTEAEFGFEPSLLVEMERTQTPTGTGGFTIHRTATVIGDRFGVLDGKTRVDPTFKFFLPHIKLLTPGAHAPVDTAVKTDAGVDEDGGDAWARERKTRTILAEEIQGELVNAYPGQTAAEKKAKADLLAAFFGTRSWTAVEGMDSGRLRHGLRALRERLGVQASDVVTGPGGGSNAETTVPAPSGEGPAGTDGTQVGPASPEEPQP
jgi:hypothetical protein